MYGITFSGVVYILVSFFYIMNHYVHKSLNWRSVLLAGLLGVAYLVTAIIMYIMKKSSRRAESFFVSTVVGLLAAVYFSIFLSISRAI